ncbi:uncharacterized protein LOC126747119 [Anthonomus grandis grandis]|uniref:uncharacterized protein LOC126747119 n=1 Tax=Anthonomus grandis grandis TaxID=2921223 RepID=UPI0021664C19|nr:uncharacterized protein LOC126747119 [Anthonomus grandis grandis]
MASFFYNYSESDDDDPGLRWHPGRLLELLGYLAMEIYEEIHDLEQFFIKLYHVYGFVCQVNFYLLCYSLFYDRTRLLPLRAEKIDEPFVVALTTILFYSVFAYFATRARDIYTGNRARTISAISPSFFNYFKWFCRIFLEWAKAVVVILCLREEGINYQPSLIYSLITFIYFLCTEKCLLEIVSQLIGVLGLDHLEHLYVPLGMNVLAITMGVAVGGFNCYLNSSPYQLLPFYFMVYLRVKDAYFNCWINLEKEKRMYSQFQVATNEDIDNWDDICAVCLNRMSHARITPCRHLFHPNCLKQCIRNSPYCPLCKQHFLAGNK